MKNTWLYRFAFVALSLMVLGSPLARAAPMERRIALVIGNANYQSKPLVTPANDAGLIAQTLQASGFDVVGARDVDADTLRHALRDFVDKAASSGPDTVALIYIAGYGLQYEGENYIVPVDARIERDIDVPIQAVRLSDYIRPLNATPLRLRMVVIDAARDSPFAKSGQPLASGLALVDPEPGLLVGFNAAPGTIAPEGAGPYGHYAQALAEMIREGGLSPTEIFDRLRQRVADVSGGAFIPWNASRVESSFVFFERAADAPPPAVSRRDLEIRHAKSIREFEVEDAYHEALDRDTLDGYIDFLDAYPRHPLAKRVRVIVAARREAITWRRTYRADTPPAYWSYLDRYPTGPHAWDARRRLRHLAAEMEPPASFVTIEYDVPPPPREEIVFVERPVLVFSDPYFDFAPPPRPRIYFVSAPPPDFIVLEAPPPVFDAFVLPVPVFVPVARWCDPPRYVEPPPQNVIFNNIHNTVVVNSTTVNTTNITTTSQTVVNPAGPNPNPGTSLTAGQIGAAAVGAGVVAASLKVALPPAIAKKQAVLPTQGTPGAPLTVGAPALVGPNGITIPLAPPKAAISTPAAPIQNATRGSQPVAPAYGKSPPVPAALGSARPPEAVKPSSAVAAPPSKGPLGPKQPAVTGPNPMPGNAPAQAQNKTALPATAQQPNTHTPGPVPAVIGGQSGQGTVPKPADAKFAPNQQVPAIATTAPAPRIGNKRASKPSDTTVPPTLPSVIAPVHGVAKVPDVAGTNPASKAVQDRAKANQDAHQDAQRKAQQQAAQESQRRAQQQAAQNAQRRAQQAAQEAQRKAQQQAAQETQRRAQQQASQDAQRKAQQQAAQETQRRAQQQDAQRKAEQQAGQDAQRRAQQQAAQDAQRKAQQLAAQEQQKRKAQQPEQKKCGQPGLPACPPN